ncbi:hypothetical protein STEG23_031400 [Scotinomys teguina]
MAAAAPAAEGEDAPAQPESKKEPDMSGARDECEEEEEEDDDDEDEEEEKRKEPHCGRQERKEESRKIDNASVFLTERAIYN